MKLKNFRLGDNLGGVLNAIDIIFVNYNSSQLTLNAIDSIYAHLSGVSANIIVVDNASSDHPARICKQFPHVQLIINQRNLGYSKAINQAIEYSNGKYLVIMNPDTLVVNGFFTDVLQFMQDNDHVGVVGPKILNKDGSVQGSARRFPSIRTALFGRNSFLTKLFPNNPITQSEFFCFRSNGNGFMNVDWVSGACMVLKREAFESINGFDERFFMYWEDTDLCKRMCQAGYGVVYYPNAQVVHFVGVSSDTRPMRSIFHFHQSSYKFFAKHTTGLGKLLLAPVAVLGLTVRCMLLMISRFVPLKNLNVSFKQKRLLKQKVYPASKPLSIKAGE